MVRDDSKQILLSVFGIAILLIAVVGISYAIFSYSTSSNSENTIKSGGIQMSFIESDTNVINIKNAMPMSDESGKIQSNYFDFSIVTKINGITDINYSVVAKSILLRNQLDSKKVKIYLEKYENGVYKSVLDPSNFLFNSNDLISNSNEFDSMLLYRGSFSSNTNQVMQKEDKFRLRMWIDSSAKIENSSKGFKVKVNVAATS